MRSFKIMSVLHKHIFHLHASCFCLFSIKMNVLVLKGSKVSTHADRPLLFSDVFCQSKASL